MTKTLRVGMVGINPDGGWARESHVPAVQALPGLELAGVAGRTRDLADAAARKFGIGRAFDSVGDMFRDPDIDIVTIAATLPAHRELLLAALQAGKHVYCEYPLGLDAAESRVLAQAAEEAGVHAAIGLQARANPAMRQARALLRAGAIGRPLFARVISPTAGFGPAIPPEVAYTEDPANGVWLVTIQSAHTIDLAIALLGAATEVSGLATTQYPDVRIGDGPVQKRRTSDHLLVQARLASGVALSAEIAGGRPPETPFHLEITGETGVLALVGGAPRGFQSGRLRLLVDGVTQDVDHGDLASLPDAAVNVGGTYADLRDDIGSGNSNAVGFPHAVRLAQLIEDTMISAQTGQRQVVGDWPHD